MNPMIVMFAVLCGLFLWMVLYMFPRRPNVPLWGKVVTGGLMVLMLVLMFPQIKKAREKNIRLASENLIQYYEDFDERRRSEGATLPTEAALAVYTKEPVKLRTKASAKAKVITSLPAKIPVKVIDRDKTKSDWFFPHH